MIIKSSENLNMFLVFELSLKNGWEELLIMPNNYVENFFLWSSITWLFKEIFPKGPQDFPKIKISKYLKSISCHIYHGDTSLEYEQKWKAILSFLAELRFSRSS